MQFTITTRVEQPFRTVFAGFNRALFMALKPPLVPMKLLRFDGCNTGDEVHLNLGFGQEWISIITEFSDTSNAVCFTDVGKKLPFFLQSWQHKHSITAAEGNPNESLITDTITYQSHNTLLTRLLYPVLYMQFAWRKPVYRRFFGKTTAPLQ
ncbi:hypothetical protein C7N43_01520 [Sphingobacteriales bacterium UPWRP_1]|nr:hypothetical protein BVG80_10490 [Sphingobacteriales bacterium TSM_CSM]PSJ78845.1 hypothetical protein C7N43_01520 [Sphingobacteriales bacterium UPWRP_1]